MYVYYILENILYNIIYNNKIDIINLISGTNVDQLETNRIFGFCGIYLPKDMAKANILLMPAKIERFLAIAIFLVIGGLHDVQ